MQQEKASHISPSPSFSSYSSSETLAQIAARVIEELRWDPHSVSDDETLLHPWENDTESVVNDDIPIQNDDGFEFAFVSRDPTTSPVSADDIFYNGQIKPMYPTILDENDAVSSFSPIPNKSQDAAETKRRRPPLRKLMSEERETASCSSSTSEAGDSVDLEGAEEGSYCVWNPNSVTIRERSKKSNSANSVSKRWKLRNLVLGGYSEGSNKDKKMAFQVPSKRTNKVASEAAKPSSGDSRGGALVESDVKSRTVRTVKDGEKTKRKTFLPYKQELVGLFAK